MTKLYRELADWWPLLSSPAEYAEEAAHFHALLREADPPPRTLLELGSGGGNNASHLKAHYALTLVELSPEMVAVSERLNPRCEHHVGDMRTVRLGRTFDAVFVHDAVMYMASEADLAAAIETAAIHLRPGGTALFAPDCVRETFSADSECGGHDGPDRSLRYLEWSGAPEPGGTTFPVDYVVVLRGPGDALRVEHERHTMGVFPRDQWLALLERHFTARVEPDPWGRELFVATRRS